MPKTSGLNGGGVAPFDATSHAGCQLRDSGPHRSVALSEWVGEVCRLEMPVGKEAGGQNLEEGGRLRVGQSDKEVPTKD